LILSVFCVALFRLDGCRPTVEACQDAQRLDLSGPLRMGTVSRVGKLLVLRRMAGWPELGSSRSCGGWAGWPELGIPKPGGGRPGWQAPGSSSPLQDGASLMPENSRNSLIICIFGQQSQVAGGWRQHGPQGERARVARRSGFRRAKGLQWDREGFRRSSGSVRGGVRKVGGQARKSSSGKGFS
jgi:hypothetical protein